MNTLDKLTSTQVLGLYLFAQQHGRYWRSLLVNQWAESSDPPLVTVRNAIGPLGLRRFTNSELCVAGAAIEHKRLLQAAVAAGRVQFVVVGGDSCDSCR
jgi:hypothetical protein